jgi:hypothetical protein
VNFQTGGSEGWGSNPIAIVRRAILGFLVAMLQVGQRPGGPLVVAALDDRPSAGSRGVALAGLGGRGGAKGRAAPRRPSATCSGGRDYLIGRRAQ